MRSETRETTGLLLVAALPLASFPLSWLPQQVAHYRFVLALPMAATVLMASLLALGGWLLRGKPPRSPLQASSPVDGSAPSGRGGFPAFLWPAIVVLLDWLLSVRCSRRQYVSIEVLPVLLGNLAVFVLATRFPPRAWRKLLWVWVLTATLVAVNGMARLRTESEFVSTIGNWNFLAAYLAAAIAMGVALWDKRAAVFCVLLLAALCFCRSRGAWLALAITALLWLIWGNRSRPAARIPAGSLPWRWWSRHSCWDEVTLSVSGRGRCVP